MIQGAESLKKRSEWKEFLERIVENANKRIGQPFEHADKVSQWETEGRTVFAYLQTELSPTAYKYV